MKRKRRRTRQRVKRKTTRKTMKKTSCLGLSLSYLKVSITFQNHLYSNLYFKTGKVVGTKKEKKKGSESSGSTSTELSGKKVAITGALTMFLRKDLVEKYSDLPSSPPI